MHWADKISRYNRELNFRARLPKNISVMNPYADDPNALSISDEFYHTYYSDDAPRKIILGINPGRHGGGATGIPFTDPKRLSEVIRSPWKGNTSHEPSSVFIYDMVNAFGGPAAFYARYFINSVSPLGYTIRNASGKEVNFNYYDTPPLFKAVMPFIISNLNNLRDMGFDMETCYCLGKKNALCLGEINAKSAFFKQIISLEHPRYIMQYRLKSKDEYIRKYLDVLA